MIFSRNIHYWVRFHSKVAVGAITSIISGVITPSKSYQNAVVLDVSRHVYHRYIFLLIESFLLTGSTVFIKVRKESLSELRRCRYIREILSDKRLQFTLLSKSCTCLSDMDENSDRGRYTKTLKLSSLYFSKKAEESRSKVQILQHPTMYIKGLWNLENESEHNKLNACIGYGNFDPQVYSKITEQHLFDIVNRVELLNHIKKIGRYHEFNANQLTSTDRAPTTEKIHIAESGYNSIRVEQIRSVLSMYRYVICFPGAEYPLCHNLIEALSVGCVPILQGEYARLLNPPLVDGETAFIFNDTNDFEEKLNEAFSLSDDNWQAMSDRCLAYYQCYCTPSAVVNLIENLKPEYDLYLLGCVKDNLE